MNDSGGAGGPRLGDRQRLNWLRLIRTDNVGPATFRDLVNRFGSAETALSMLPELARHGGALKPVRIPSLAEIDAEMELAARCGARFVAVGEPDYPPMLRRTENPPPLVAIKARLYAVSAEVVHLRRSRRFLPADGPRTIL